MRNLAIFGASTLAKQVHYYAAREMGLSVCCFVVHDEFHDRDTFQSLPVMRWSDFIASQGPDSIAVHVAIGYRVMRARAAAFELARCAGYEMVSIISTSAYIAQDVVLGSNNLVLPGAVLENGVSMGANNVVWSNATICHDCCVGSHNFFAANTTLGGGASIGDGNFLGFSSVVMQGLKVGNETLVGAQALVRHDTQDLSRYLGSPAVRSGTVDPGLGICVS